MTQIHPDLSEESTDPARRITPLTRRDIFDYIRTEGGPWWGRLDEIDFLARIYDLEALPSNDYRFKTATGDIWQHRFNNLDWDDYWVFSDSRFQLASGPDEVLLAKDARSNDSGGLCAGGAPRLGADRPTQAARGRGGGKKKVHLASEEDLARDYPEFDLGAVPPISGGRCDPVVIDSRLAESDSLVLEAGSHEESVRVPTSDFLRVSEAEVADICVD